MVVLGDSSPLRLGKIEPSASGVVLAGGLTGSKIRRHCARITLVTPKYPQKTGTSEKQGVLTWEVGSKANLGWCQGCQRCYQGQSIQELDVQSTSAWQQLQHSECSHSQPCQPGPTAQGIWSDPALYKAKDGIRQLSRDFSGRSHYHQSYFVEYLLQVPSLSFFWS